MDNLDWKSTVLGDSQFLTDAIQSGQCVYIYIYIYIYIYTPVGMGVYMCLHIPLLHEEVFKCLYTYIMSIGLSLTI